jgi:hypothetical protein
MLGCPPYPQPVPHRGEDGPGLDDVRAADARRMKQDGTHGYDDDSCGGTVGVVDVGFYTDPGIETIGCHAARPA